MLAALSIAVVAFVSTNIDGMLVLVGFLADPTYRTRTVVLGEYLGIGALVSVSLACALLVVAMPGEYVGLLGIAPIVIGLAKLRAAWQEQRDGAAPQRGGRAGRSKVLAVAGVTIANGGDNLGTYIPLFATSTTVHLLATVAVFAAMAALWCALAHLLVQHHALGALIRRWGSCALPFVLIVLGAYMLWQSGSVGLLHGGGAAS